MKVLKIGAKWCQGCKVMGPRWKEIESENPWLQTEFYDFDENKEFVCKMNITAMPSFVFLDQSGNELIRLSGEVEKEKIIETINQYKEK
ncbi:MAG: thioredoxin family protein [Candidatus Paceibacterota bacterium]